MHMSMVGETIKNTLKGYIPGDITGPQSNLPALNGDNSTLGQSAGDFGTLRETIEPHTTPQGRYYEDTGSHMDYLMKERKPLTEEQMASKIQEQLQPKLFKDRMDRMVATRKNPLPEEDRPFRITYGTNGIKIQK